MLQKLTITPPPPIVNMTYNGSILGGILTGGLRGTGDNGNYIKVPTYSYFTTVTAWGPSPNHRSHPKGLLRIMA